MYQNVKDFQLTDLLAKFYYQSIHNNGEQVLIVSTQMSS